MKTYLYEYKCEACGTYRWWAYDTKPPLTECPICGTPGLVVLARHKDAGSVENRGRGK